MAFSINDIEFTVNGRQITDWSDDSDFLMFPEAKAHTKTRIGGGGRRLRVSDPARFGGAVTIKLLPGSDDVVYMQRLGGNVQEQHGTSHRGIGAEPGRWR